MKLMDICNINMGQSPDSSSYNEDQKGIPFFQGNADFGERYPCTRIWCSKPTKIANEGDILISVRAPIGAMNIANQKCCIGRGLAALTVDTESCDENFLWYALSSKVSELQLKGTGSTFKAISKQVLQDIEIPVPTLAKQKHISCILDKLTDLINKRKQQLQKLDELVKARFVEMFGDPDTNNKNWDVYKLDELCDIGSSKRIYQNEQSSKGVPFWRISDLTDKMDTGVVDNKLFIPEQKYEELRIHGLVPIPGDILVTSRGTLGRCYIISDNDRFYFQDGMISWLSHYKKGVTPLYIQYLFMTQSIKNQIDSMQTGTTVSYLSIAMLKKLDIMVPDEEIQHQFEDFVKQIEKSKSKIQKSLNKLELLKKALMQEYFG